MQIRIDHHSDEARDARSRVTALASALEDTREEYLTLVEAEIRRVLEQGDPESLTQVIADIVDASAVIAYALGTSLAQEWDVDLGSLFRGVERFLDEQETAAADAEEHEPAPDGHVSGNGTAPLEDGASPESPEDS